jgi:ABC-2 type transport system permease protein
MPAQAVGAAGASLLTYLDLGEHFYPTLYRGIVELGDIVYFLSLTALALFLATMTVEMRRWR